MALAINYVNLWGPSGFDKPCPAFQFLAVDVLVCLVHVTSTGWGTMKRRRGGGAAPCMDEEEDELSQWAILEAVVKLVG